VARLAVLASGNGSNFEALARALRERPASEGPRHECALLIYDRKAAFAARRAIGLGIPALYVTYFQRNTEEAEAEIGKALEESGADLVALAGFMRILSPAFVVPRRGRVVNVHPSLLPAWPGAHAIERAYEAGSPEFGVTVHYVDEGMDTGAVIASGRFERRPGETLGDIESRVHAIEHEIYPRAVLALLDKIEAEGRRM
jgi:formyltetrahydrofolate-dependent phosphoribosylglycinamide formyltransferase